MSTEMTYEQAQANYREYQQLMSRKAILEAQTSLGAKQQNDAAKAQAALEVSRFFQQKQEAQTQDHYRKQEIQRSLDQAFEAHNLMTPMPRADETSFQYQRRLLSEHLKKYSPEWRDMDLNQLPPNALENVGKVIVQDALKPVSHGFDVPPGQIKEIVRRDEGNRKIHEFVNGDGQTTFVHQMAAQLPRRVVGWIHGMRQVGTDVYSPRENPHSVGPQALRGGIPR